LNGSWFGLHWLGVVKEPTSAEMKSVVAFRGEAATDGCMGIGKNPSRGDGSRVDRMTTAEFTAIIASDGIRIEIVLLETTVDDLSLEGESDRRSGWVGSRRSFKNRCGPVPSRSQAPRAQVKRTERRPPKTESEALRPGRWHRESPWQYRNQKPERAVFG